MCANIFILAWAALIIGARAQCINFNFGSNTGVTDTRNRPFGLAKLTCGSEDACDIQPFPNCNTATIRPALSLSSRSNNCEQSECESRISASNCNTLCETARPTNPFLNRNTLDCETRTPTQIRNSISITETSRPLNPFLNRNSNSPCAPSASECQTTNSCNTGTESETTSSLRSRLITNDCGSKVTESTTSRFWKRPLQTSNNACETCNAPALSCSCRTDTTTSSCGTSSGETLPSRPLSRFFNRPTSNQPCADNNEVISCPCDTPCADASRIFNGVLNKPIFEAYPPVNNLPCVDNIRPNNVIIDTPSIGCNCRTPCTDLGSCNGSNRPGFESCQPLNNMPRIEINKRLPECSQFVNHQPCVDDKPNCNSIETPPCGITKSCNRPVNNIDSISCRLSKSGCDICDNVNSFNPRIPNNPFRPCSETSATSCNINSGCNCNPCADFIPSPCVQQGFSSLRAPILPSIQFRPNLDFPSSCNSNSGCNCNSCGDFSTSPCFQQGFSSLQAPIVPSLNSQIQSNCATPSVVDSSVVNSLTDSIQLLIIANLIQNSMYINSLTGNPCSNNDILGSVQCVLDNTPACGCGCTDVVEICNNAGCVDVNPCNNGVDVTTCNTGVQDCGSCYPDYANFGCQGFPDVITSVLNCRGKPLPEVLNLLGCSCFGNIGRQCGCGGDLINSQIGGCSALPEVVTPLGGCSGVPNFGGFLGCNNLPQWSPCASNIPAGIPPYFGLQGYQECNPGFDGYSNLPQVVTPLGMCNGIPDIVQPLQVPYGQGSCGYQGNYFGIGGCAPDINSCGFCSRPPNVVQPLTSYGCNELPIASLGCNNIQEIATANFINIPESIPCYQQCDNNGYQGFSNPFANVVSVQQNVPLVPQIYGLQESINCIDVTQNGCGIQEYITPVAQSYVTPQSCQEVPVIPAYFMPDATDCSNNVPEVTISANCFPETTDCNYNCIGSPIELSLPQTTDFGYALELPRQAEILIPSSMPAQLWVDPDSLPSVYLSIDPTFGGSYRC